MSDITFDVIDTVCQAADRSFFPPHVSLSTVSTTVAATLYGYNEFIPSSPPKKYHSVTFQGEAERTAFTFPDGIQCAGAQYVWSGVGTIDGMGHQTSNYTKELFAQCNRTVWPTFALDTGVAVLFIGYCWPPDSNSCPVCDPDDTNWPFLGNFSTNNPPIDLVGFQINPADKVTTATSVVINGTFNGTIPQPHLVGSLNSILMTDVSDYSAVLSNEYTDAEALANATSVVSNGATAQNLPRTTGFTSTTSAVAYTLNFTDLIVGEPYLSTVDLWDVKVATNASVHTPKSYGFIATATTHVIHDTVDLPAAGHITTVRLPTVSFA